MEPCDAALRRLYAFLDGAESSIVPRLRLGFRLARPDRLPQGMENVTTRTKERRKGRSTQGRVHGIRFDWDDHGAEGYAVAVQERSHDDSGDLIAAKIRRDWSSESEAAQAEDSEEATDEAADDAADGDADPESS